MVTLFGLKSVFRHTLYIFTWSFSLSHYMYNWNPFLYSLLFCCSSGIPFDIFRLIVCEYRLFCLAEPTQWVNGKFYIQTFSQKYLTHLLWYFNDQRKMILKGFSCSRTCNNKGNSCKLWGGGQQILLCELKFFLFFLGGQLE